MDGPHTLVVEDSPDPADLALLEERVTAAAIAAAGLGDEEEFGIFVRDERPGGRGRLRHRVGWVL